ncbi:hypothetical protein LCL89_14035 [Halobacillus yeomjeoni]|uniref:hypothetical protein n=1 Tax=Halobacillus yeomjeoni TaxID=311194 RepID=UPI001CD44DB3|nr:hypothetical protein [Halobacillus yeomjeoni]MCA0985147.1 hypothetical protein [Halobacillus yeomjeoni]
MRAGHKLSQERLLKLGEEMNFIVKKTFSQSLPTDGVWLIKNPLLISEFIPFLAVEVIVSESPKTIRGSIKTLEQVKPTIAVVFIHEGEIVARWARQKMDAQQIHEKIKSLYNFLEKERLISSVRLEIWNEDRLSHLESYCYSLKEKEC